MKTAHQEVAVCPGCGLEFVRTIRLSKHRLVTCGNCLAPAEVKTHGCILLVVESAPVDGHEACGVFGQWDIDDGGCRSCSDEASCFGEWAKKTGNFTMTESLQRTRGS